MNTEFEATFTDIDVEAIRKKLRELKAELIKPETLMRRMIFYPPLADELGWMRVRDEGDKVTLSYKRFLGYNKVDSKIKIDDQQEICLIINSFNDGVKLLETIGAKRKAYQETKREEWHYQGAEITIDTWPGLDPFVEIEGVGEETVKQVAATLGFDYSDAIFGPSHIVYEKKLGIPAEVINNHTPEITFENPPKKYRK